jgi:hypothetical protein
MISNDLLWKGVIEDFFQPFFGYFFSKYQDEIDWTKPVEYLDTELSKIQPKENRGKNIADKLVKVYLKNGNEHWFIIHIEIQGHEDMNMPKRMFKMHTRIKDKYDANVTSLLILVYKNAKDKGKYEDGFMGSKTIFYYNVYNLFLAIENDAYDKNNIFSFIARAAYINIKFDQKEAIKLQEKDKLFRDFFKQKRIDKSKFRLLLNFINDFIRFRDKDYQEKNEELLQTYHKTKHMGLEQLYQQEIEKVVSKREKIAVKKGIEKGIEQGIEQGMARKNEQFILNGYANQISIKKMSIITLLSEKEVRAILKKHNKI